MDNSKKKKNDFKIHLENKLKKMHFMNSLQQIFKNKINMKTAIFTFSIFINTDNMILSFDGETSPTFKHKPQYIYILYKSF